jgi:hypothetical protein
MGKHSDMIERVTGYGYTLKGRLNPRAGHRSIEIDFGVRLGDNPAIESAMQGRAALAAKEA